MEPWPWQIGQLAVADPKVPFTRVSDDDTGVGCGFKVEVADLITRKSLKKYRPGPSPAIPSDPVIV